MEVNYKQLADSGKSERVSIGCCKVIDQFVLAAGSLNHGERRPETHPQPKHPQINTLCHQPLACAWRQCIGLKLRWASSKNAPFCGQTNPSCFGLLWSDGHHPRVVNSTNTKFPPQKWNLPPPLVVVIRDPSKFEVTMILRTTTKLQTTKFPHSGTRDSDPRIRSFEFSTRRQHALALELLAGVLSESGQVSERSSAREELQVRIMQFTQLKA